MAEGKESYDSPTIRSVFGKLGVKGLPKIPGVPPSTQGVEVPHPGADKVAEEIEARRNRRPGGGVPPSTQGVEVPHPGVEAVIERNRPRR